MDFRSNLKQISISESTERLFNLSSGDCQYIKDISVIPILSASEEYDLACKISSGDEQAKNKLIESNLRLVVNICRDYAGRGVPFIDLVQEGNLGLIKAVDKYDVSFGCRFSTYATFWIKQAIYRGITNKSRIVRVPYYLYTIIYNIAAYENDYYKDNDGEKPTYLQIAKALKISEEQVLIAKKASQSIISLEMPVNEKSDSLIIDYISDDGETDRKINLIDNIDYVEKILCCLEEKEKKIVILRYGLLGEESKTLEEIGEIFGISREYVRQKLITALEKLSKYSKMKTNNDYFKQKTKRR